MRQAIVAVLRPAWDRTCDDCRRWLHDDKPGGDGSRVTRLSLPVARPPGVPTPCERCPKIPDGRPKVPAEAVEVTDQFRAALRHFEECRAVGAFPDDAWVRRNAVIFAEAFAALDRGPMQQLVAVLAAKK